MKNKSIKIIFILMFALALGAGVVAGKLSNRLVASEPPTVEPGTLSDVLHLDSDQRAKMQAIWEKVRDTSRDCLSEAEAIQKDQDTQVMEMLNEEQRKKFGEIRQAASGKIEVLNQRRKTAFSKGVAETDSILNETQRKAYHEIIKDRLGRLPNDDLDRP